MLTIYIRVNSKHGPADPYYFFFVIGQWVWARPMDRYKAGLLQPPVSVGFYFSIFRSAIYFINFQFYHLWVHRPSNIGELENFAMRFLLMRGVNFRCFFCDKKCHGVGYHVPDQAGILFFPVLKSGASSFQISKSFWLWGLFQYEYESCPGSWEQEFAESTRRPETSQSIWAGAIPKCLDRIPRSGCVFAILWRKMPNSFCWFFNVLHREMMNFTMGFGGTKLGSPVFSQRQDLALWSTV